LVTIPNKIGTIEQLNTHTARETERERERERKREKHRYTISSKGTLKITRKDRAKCLL